MKQRSRSPTNLVEGYMPNVRIDNGGAAAVRQKQVASE